MMETFAGGQCKLIYTDCTFNNLNESIEEFSAIEVASEKMDCVCSSRSNSIKCIKSLFSSQKLCADFGDKNHGIFLLVGNRELYKEFSEYFPLIGGGALDKSVRELEFSTNKELTTNKASSSANEQAEKWPAAAELISTAAEKLAAAAEKLAAAAEKMETAAAKWWLGLANCERKLWEDESA